MDKFAGNLFCEATGIFTKVIKMTLFMENNGAEYNEMNN